MFRMKILLEQVEETERPVIMQVAKEYFPIRLPVSLQGVVATL